MTPNLNSATFFTLTIGMLIFIFLMLLPAIIELKKPKDAGPRVITEDFSLTRWIEGDILLNIEDEHMFDQNAVQNVAEVLQFLPNLED